MSTTLTVTSLIHAVAGHAAFRRVRRLQPVGGVGDKLFPPTYPRARDGVPESDCLRENVVRYLDTT